MLSWPFLDSLALRTRLSVVIVIPDVAQCFSRHPGRRPGIQYAVVVTRSVVIGKLIKKERMPTTWSWLASLDSRLRGNDRWGVPQLVHCRGSRCPCFVIPGTTNHPGRHESFRAPQKPRHPGHHKSPVIPGTTKVLSSRAPQKSCHPGHRPGIQGAVVVTRSVVIGKLIKKERMPTTWSWFASLDSRLRGNDMIACARLSTPWFTVPLSRHPGHHKKSRHPGHHKKSRHPGHHKKFRHPGRRPGIQQAARG